MLKKIQAQLNQDKSEIEPKIKELQKEEHEAISPDDLMEPSDLSNQSEHKVVVNLLEYRLKKKLELIHQAITRLEQGKFGICTSCEEPIPLNRIMANYSALCCLGCQEEKEGLRTHKKDRKAG